MEIKKMNIENDVAVSVKDLSKQFKSGYGIKQINFEVKRGTVYGYLGPNGAGKSTTIRSLMGFIKPNSGQSNIIKMSDEQKIENIVSYDSWTDSNQIQKIIGYVPGEIAFPETMTGLDLLKMVFKFRNMSDWEQVKKHIYYWEFDPSLKIKKMSKGMKQKLALCIAWMHNPDIIILDEPTTGLDPLMQEKFVSLIKKSKEEGKAIILSSHIFSEIEKTCDIVSIVKRGEIISTIDIKDIKYNEEKTYEIKFSDKISDEILKSEKWKVTKTEGTTAIVVVENKIVNEFISAISKCKVQFWKEHPLDLEQYFMKYYQNEIIKDVVTNIEKHNEKMTKKVTSNSKGNSKAIFELTNRSFRKMILMWSFMTILMVIMISAMLITLKANGSLVPEMLQIQAIDPITNLPIYDENNLPVMVDIPNSFGQNIDQTVQMLLGAIATGSMGCILFAVFVVMNGTKLVATEVESGVLVNLITTNLTRKSIILTKMFTFMGLIAISVLIQFIVIPLGLSIIGVAKYVEFSDLTIKYLGYFLLLFFSAGFTFLASCYFNKGGQTLGITGAMVILGWVFQIASSFDDLNWMKYLSYASLYSPTTLVTNNLETWLPHYITLTVGGIGFFISSYFVFVKKDLPL